MGSCRSPLRWGLVKRTVLQGANRGAHWHVHDWNRRGVPQKVVSKNKFGTVIRSTKQHADVIAAGLSQRLRTPCSHWHSLP